MLGLSWYCLQAKEHPLAKILPLLGEITGSVGGSTFARNAGGSYVRARAAGTNPNTIKQQRARAFLGSNASRFEQITQTQKDEWADFALYWNSIQPQGSKLNLTAAQLYTTLNVARQYGGMAPVSTPPTAVRPAALTTLTADPHESTVDLTWTPSPLGSGQRVLLWQAPPHNGGRRARFHDATICAVTTSAAGTSPDTIALAHPMQIGQSASFWGVHIQTTDWVLGPPIRLEATRTT